MNKRRLTSFRNWFAKQDPDEYYQWNYEKCVWGLAKRWAGTRRTPIDTYDGGCVSCGSEAIFAEVFGISIEASSDVFVPEFAPECISPTKEDALKMLDALIATGKVKWLAKYNFEPRVEG